MRQDASCSSSIVMGFPTSGTLISPNAMDVQASFQVANQITCSCPPARLLCSPFCCLHCFKCMHVTYHRVGHQHNSMTVHAWLWVSQPQGAMYASFLPCLAICATTNCIAWPPQLPDPLSPDFAFFGGAADASASAAASDPAATLDSSLPASAGESAQSQDSSGHGAASVPLAAAHGAVNTTAALWAGVAFASASAGTCAVPAPDAH